MSKRNMVDISRDRGVSIMRLNNQRTRNSLCPDMRTSLAAAFRHAAEDKTVRVVYLTGAGGAFCSGGDLNALRSQQSSWEVHQRFRQLGSWLLPFLQFEKPVVVGLNGYAVGGGIGLALAGDVLIAAKSAKLMSGFFRLGVIPDFGMMYTLPRLIGLARAKQFLFGNGTLSAEQALELGLVTEVVSNADLDEVCLKKAREFAEGPIRAMGLAKLIMARSFETDLSDMFLLEGLGQALMQSGEEFSEGLNALTAKRPARFQAQTED